MSITIAEYNDKLNSLLNISADSVIDGIIIPAANLLLGEIKNRIALDGKDSDGNALSPYSTKPWAFTKEQFAKPSAFVANGKKDTDVGLRETMFIQDGYKGLRDIQGKPTNIKNLTYTGDMLHSYVEGRDGDNILLGFDSNEESGKRKANEAREGVNIFEASEKEKKNYQIEFFEAYRELIKNKNL